MMKIADMFKASLVVHGRSVLAAADKLALSITFQGAQKVYTFKDNSILVVNV